MHRHRLWPYESQRWLNLSEIAEKMAFDRHPDQGICFSEDFRAGVEMGVQAAIEVMRSRNENTPTPTEDHPQGTEGQPEGSENP